MSLLLVRYLFWKVDIDLALAGFGEASTAMVEGLTTGSDSQTLDFSTVVRRMKVVFCFCDAHSLG